MADIRFYHLQRQTIDEALPKLAELVVKSGKKGLIKVADKNIAKKLDKALWTYRPESFLPHDIESTKYPDDQALLITTTDENPASAKMIILVNGVDADELVQYERILYMFEGQQDEIIAKARSDWKEYKKLDFEMSYWQQKDQGGWEQKA